MFAKSYDVTPVSTKHMSFSYDVIASITKEKRFVTTCCAAKCIFQQFASLITNASVACTKLRYIWYITTGLFHITWSKARVWLQLFRQPAQAKAQACYRVDGNYSRSFARDGISQMASALSASTISSYIKCSTRFVMLIEMGVLNASGKRHA